MNYATVRAKFAGLRNEKAPARRHGPGLLEQDYVR